MCWRTAIWKPVLPRKNKFYAYHQMVGKSRTMMPAVCRKTISYHGPPTRFHLSEMSCRSPPNLTRPLKASGRTIFVRMAFCPQPITVPGLVTAGQDVSRKYSVDAGIRYSFDLDYISVVAGANAEDFGLRLNRWGKLSSFRVGLGWPVIQPDYLDESTPVLLIQLGNPL